MSKSVNRPVRLSAELDDALKNLPVKKSAAIAQGIINAYEKPDLLGKALNARRLEIHPDEVPNDVRIAVSLSDVTLDFLQHLTKMSRLPAEEVIRLTTEAYIKRL